MAGQFLRRRHPTKHKCSVPHWRWLPWLVVPRWRDGAQWQCGRWGDPRPGWAQGRAHVPYEWIDGCGKTWICRLYLGPRRAVWVDESTLPKGSLEPIFVIDPDTGERIPNSPPVPPA